ncbi:hypothetical protein P5673_005342 [Acropora cervicornis]|uniref:Uncharacterized protein n=1 Tax=Acropora cervicornis TaxID=6130 RepID=A0AAD9VCQ7_ACRCE|nr:hypothetical protein P5673_005342 [Acropora cervicornis]
MELRNHCMVQDPPLFFKATMSGLDVTIMVPHWDLQQLSEKISRMSDIQLFLESSDKLCKGIPKWYKIRHFFSKQLCQATLDFDVLW